jgi:hypothetical protein
MDCYSLASNAIALKVRYPMKTPSRPMIVLMSPKAIAIAVSEDPGSQSTRISRRKDSKGRREGSG